MNEAEELLAALEDAVHHPESWNIQALLNDAAITIRQLLNLPPSVSHNYPDGMCPQCHNPVPDNAADGSLCQCGFTFRAPTMQPDNRTS